MRSKEDFIKYIESVGFVRFNSFIYNYNGYGIMVSGEVYSLNDSKSMFRSGLKEFDDIDIINEKFKKEARSFKLKQLLK